MKLMHFSAVPVARAFCWPPAWPPPRVVRVPGTPPPRRNEYSLSRNGQSPDKPSATATESMSGRSSKPG